MGLEIGLGDLFTLGWLPALGLSFAVLTRFTFSLLSAKLFGLRKSVGAPAGPGTAICGASAILAAAPALPKCLHSDNDISTLLMSVVLLSVERAGARGSIAWNDYDKAF